MKPIPDMRLDIDPRWWAWVDRVGYAAAARRVIRLSRPDAVQIWVDGSSSQQKRTAGAGVVVVDTCRTGQHGGSADALAEPARVAIHGVPLPYVSANRAEAHALMLALDIVEDKYLGRPVDIYTDSSFVVTYTRHIPRKDLNYLWGLTERVKHRNIRIIQVRSRAGFVYHRMADKAANTASRTGVRIEQRQDQGPYWAELAPCVLRSVLDGDFGQDFADWFRTEFSSTRALTATAG